MAKNKDYRDSLTKSLKNDKEAVAYLDAAIEDGDKEVFFLAIRDLIEARLGGMAKLAKKTGLSRESLYRTLSGKGNPTYEGLESILGTMGFRLSVHRKKAANE